MTLLNSSFSSTADVISIVAMQYLPCADVPGGSSNVKLANAQGSGTPIIAQMDAGYLEHGYLDAPVCWITKPDGIAEWLKILAPQSMRQEISKRLLAQAYTVEDAARDYAKFLESLCVPA